MPTLLVPVREPPLWKILLKSECQRLSSAHCPLPTCSLCRPGNRHRGGRSLDHAIELVSEPGVEPRAPHSRSWAGCRTARPLGSGGAMACGGRKGHFFQSKTWWWRWWQGAGGGLALLSRTSPKPVTPRHLETITGNNEGSGEPGCLGLGALALSVPQSKGTRSLQASPAPTFTTTVCLGTGHTGPKGPAVRKSQPLSYSGGWWPGWVPRSLAKSQKIPAGIASCSACKTPGRLLCLPGP